MSNPFPGMNPYLEKYWRDVHASFIVYAREALQERLPPGLIARIEERVYVDIPREGISRVIYPDIRVKEIYQPLASSGGTAMATATATLEEAAATATRIIVELEEAPITETYIEVVDLAGGQVVTVIEVLSISNKVPGAGQDAYRQKQKGLLEARINLVEIDLLRSGEWVLSMPESSLAPSQRTPFLVCVFRGIRPRHREVYPIYLNQPLPTVDIPLRPSDADVPLNLQEVLNRCYEAGRYDTLIDYSYDPEPPLDPESAKWLNRLLVEKGRRKAQVTPPTPA